MLVCFRIVAPAWEEGLVGLPLPVLILGAFHPSFHYSDATKAAQGCIDKLKNKASNPGINLAVWTVLLLRHVETKPCPARNVQGLQMPNYEVPQAGIRGSQLPPVVSM